MVMDKIWRDFCARWGLGEQEKRRVPLLMAALVLGLVLMCVGGRGVVGPADVASGARDVAAGNAGQDEVAALEERLAAVLGRIEGAGEVSVVLTMSAGGEMEYAANESEVRRVAEEPQGEGVARSEEVEQSREVVLAGGEALVVSVGEPRVQGVLVVATGAGDAAVRRALTDAVVSVLGVAAHRVVVLQ